MVKWRRHVGASIMILGAAVCIGMAGLASIAIAHYVEWENGADAVRTIATIAIPSAIGGLGLAVVGRWIYGGWRDGAPMRSASGWVVLVLGLIVAAIFGFELAVLLFTGIVAEDPSATTAQSIGAALGLAIVFLGFRLRAGREI